MMCATTSGSRPARTGFSSAGAVNPSGKTLDLKIDRTHRWVNLGCDPECREQSRVHGHVHVHCPDCAKDRAAGTCCTPATITAARL